jgi:hypothetical protein
LSAKRIRVLPVSCLELLRQPQEEVHGIEVGLDTLGKWLSPHKPCTSRHRECFAF